MKDLLIVLIANIVACHSLPSLDAQWETFKETFEKSYSSLQEHDARKAVFVENLKLFEKHNAEEALGLQTYTMGIGPFADMTHDEFLEQYTTSIPDDAPLDFLDATMLEPTIDPTKEVPESIDWREMGVITEVKNQGGCGSCWAFSGTGAMEAAHAIKTGNLVTLSEQNIIDCYVGNGCRGGTPWNAMAYGVKHGVDTQASYPYQAKDGQCRFKPEKVGATFKGQVAVKRNETLEKQVVGTIGPVSVSIHVGRPGFAHYKSGVYYDKECPRSVNHAVLIVGYGNLDGRDYWLVKNSWGKFWGDHGYIRMARGFDMCNIAGGICYPVPS